MAKIEQGILGPFRGTVGTVIGYRWRDRWCMRARPSHYNDRQSEAQLTQRSRFKTMIRFASPATPLLRLGLRAWAEEHGLTEGNAFLRLNHKWFSRDSSISSNIDFPSLQFSHGHLPPVEGAAAERLDAVTVSVSWRRGLGRGADHVHLYAYCPAAGRGLPVAAVERSRKHAQFILPQEFADQEIHLWAFALNADGQASPTHYIPLAAEASDAILPSALLTPPSTTCDTPETTRQQPQNQQLFLFSPLSSDTPSSPPPPQ